MRSFSKILASSTVFTSASAPFSTSAAASTAVFSFGSGATAGPLNVQFGIGVSMQGLIGQTGTASSSLGGTFSIIGSNVLEPTMFSVVATTTISSSGSWLLRDSAPWYRFVDFRFAPSGTSSSGALTVVYNQRSNE